MTIDLLDGFAGCLLGVEAGIIGKPNLGVQNLWGSIPPVPYVIAEQVHGNKVWVANSPGQVSGYDALVTNVQGLRLVIKSADCLPLLMYDPVRKVVAAVHAGREGTKLQITNKTIGVLTNQFGVNPAELLVGIGPAICVKCYQIDREQNLHYDLLANNTTQLLASGISPDNIYSSPYCTFCNGNHYLYSYRKGDASLRNYSYINLC